MLGGLIFGLVIGWVVSLFGGDSLLINGIRELTGNDITSAGYYTIFAIIGLIGGALKKQALKTKGTVLFVPMEELF